MNSGRFALIKKDIRGITSNKQIFAVLLIVPLVLTIVLPSIFVLVLTQAPDAASDFQKLLDMMPVTELDNMLNEINTDGQLDAGQSSDGNYQSQTEQTDFQINKRIIR